uniref:Uncharacterized protein n=1 Tax=Anser brachyrhynchus TaxID=132585 RepID=A0A8B9BZC9_9AVES
MFFLPVVYNICAEMCVCLVQVESCPYKLCSVDLHFQCVSGVFFLSSCKSVLLVFNLPRFVFGFVLFFFFWLGFFVLFRFRHIESLTGNLGECSEHFAPG